MESTIDTQESTITAMKTQIKLLEEQIRSEETQNRLTKEELQHAFEEVREKDNIINTKNGIISKLEHDLEDEKRKNEEADLEMTGVLSEKEKQLITLGEEKIELNNKVKRLEFKCSELNEALRITNIELADLKTEYTSYKVVILYFQKFFQF
jgi:chromosome segregation ATPase